MSLCFYCVRFFWSCVHIQPSELDVLKNMKASVQVDGFQTRALTKK